MKYQAGDSVWAPCGGRTYARVTVLEVGPAHYKVRVDDEELFVYGEAFDRRTQLAERLG